MEQLQLLNPVPQRESFLGYLFAKLPSRNAYAWLKPQALHPVCVAAGSDVDLAVIPEWQWNLLEIIEASVLVQKLQTVCFSDRTALHLQFHDDTRLSLDLIHAFRHKGYSYLSAAEVVAQVHPNAAGVCTAAPEHDWAYTTAFYSLNGAEVPERHRTRLQNHRDIAPKTIQVFAEKHFDLDWVLVDELLNPDFLKRNWLNVVSKPSLAGQLLAKFRYATDVVRQVAQPRGAVITISRVDGAGKSMILATIEDPLVLARRQELNQVAIQDLNSRYQTVFGRLKRRHPESYLPFINIHKDRTMTSITQTLQNRLGL